MTTVYPTPLLMHGTLTGRNLATPAALDSALMLTNTDRAPMLVEGLRIHNRSSSYTRISVRLGNLPITNGFVPLFALASPLDGNARVYGDVTTWRFPKPLLLLPQEKLVVEADRYNYTTRQRDTFAAYPTVLVEAVGYAGLTAQQARGERDVPYASAWVGPAGSVGPPNPNNYSASSAEPDLGNPFAVPLWCERLTGLMMNANGRDTWEYEFNAGFVRHLALRLTDSQGNVLTRSPVPFPTAFDALRNSWMVSTYLPARHFFIARVEGDLYNTGVARAYKPTPIVGLVGSRKERI